VILMQWLIDIMLELMWQSIYARGIFIHRGDPNAIDFNAASFTTDGAWHTLDLSAIVPQYAKGVCLSVLLKGNLVAKGFWFARNGQAFGRNAFRGLTQIANQVIALDGVVAVDTDRKIQYLFHNITWLQIDVTVKGWWF